MHRTIRPFAALTVAVTAVVAAAQTDHGHGTEPGHGCGNTHVHTPLLDLLPDGAPAVVAVRSGPWSSAATWGGDPPGPGDDVRIPQGVTVTFDVLDDGDRVGPDTTRVRVVRVDGVLAWAGDRSTRLFVDTLFSAPHGVIEIGTLDAPVHADHKAEIVFIADTPMSPSHDPTQLGRGFIPHGHTRVVGADKTDFAALAGDAPAGAGVLTLREAPHGWRAGDTLVLGGTFFDPAGDDADNSRFHDEVLTITAVDGRDVSFVNTAPGVEGLRWPHARPRGAHFVPEDLTLYVANITRNVTLRSELDPASPDAPAPGHATDRRRGHVMVMHTPDAAFFNAAMVDLGRSNKNAFADDPGVNVDGTPGLGLNPRGRYALHLHRNLPRGNTPVDPDDPECAPALVRGCVVHGSPGWGFVHHDSWAVFEDNVAFDVLGSAFVQEAGNEIGLWRRNISVKTTGDDNPDMTVEPFGDGHKRVTNFDFGFNGEAYWIQGASQVAFVDNVAVSCANAGADIFSDVDGNDNRDAAVVPAAHLPPQNRHIVTENGVIAVNRVPANTFSGLEVYNADFGLITWNHMRNQGDNLGFVCPCDGNVHRVHAVVEGFRFWNIFGQGVHLQYSSQIEFRDGLIASTDLATKALDDKPAVDLAINGDGRGFGLGMNGPTKRLLVDNVTIEGWRFALRTPLEGQINSLDEGEGTGSGGAAGLPLRRSVFRDLRLANNTNHFYRRQDGFTQAQTFPNSLVIERGDYSPAPGNQPPSAGFAFESLGHLGVVRLSGLPSRDDDTPGDALPPNHPLAVATNDPNFIVAYAWDLDADGAHDAFGETRTVRLPLGVDTPITLTVWDHQGLTDTVTLPVRPAPGVYADLVLDGGFDARESAGGLYALSSSGAGTGWWDARATLSSGSAVLAGQFRFSSIAQAVYDDFARRGLQRLAFDLRILEGDTDPRPGDVSRVTVRVFGINGEFASRHAEATPTPAGAVPVEITELLSASFSGATPLQRIERTFDAGPDGFQYYYLGFEGGGVLSTLPGDLVEIDNVSVLAANAPCGPADLAPPAASLDVDDVVAFVNAFNAAAAPADIAPPGGDGTLDVNDIVTFVNAFNAGCP